MLELPHHAYVLMANIERITRKCSILRWYYPADIEAAIDFYKNQTLGCTLPRLRQTGEGFLLMFAVPVDAAAAREPSGNARNSQDIIARGTLAPQLGGDRLELGRHDGP